MAKLETMFHQIVDANAVGKAIQILQDEVRSKRKKVEKAAPFVTISREFGCEGTELAIHLASILNEKLGSGDDRKWAYYDKNLLDKIAEDHNLKREIIEAAEARSRGLVEQYLSKVLSNKPDDYDVFQYAVSAMTTLASRGHVILVGRGGGIVTQGLEGGVHLRLYSGDAFKVHRLKALNEGLPDDRDEIISLIHREDRKRDSFVETYLAASPKESKFYHLMINNDRFSVPEMAEMVVCLLQSRNLL